MKTLYKLCRILPHICIILALCFLAFAVLDWFNPMMAFTTNALSRKLMLAFCASTLVSSIGNLVLMRRLTDRRR